MNYTDKDWMVRVDRFKPSGKWYDTFAINMVNEYNSACMYDSIQKCIEQEGYKLGKDWTYVCLEPYHKFSHPAQLKNRESK